MHHALIVLLAILPAAAMAQSPSFNSYRDPPRQPAPAYTVPLQPRAPATTPSNSLYLQRPAPLSSTAPPYTPTLPPPTSPNGARR